MHIREVLLYESYILDAYDVHVINKQIEELQTMIKSTADNVNYFNQSIGYSNNLDDIRANVLILINSTIDSLMITQSDIINQHLMKWQRENTLVEQSKQLDELLNSSIYKYFVNWQCEPYCHCTLEVLDRIQDWFEALANILQKTIGFMEDLRKCPIPDSQLSGFNTIDSKIKSQLQYLFESSFVVVKQPKQILKSKTK